MAEFIPLLSKDITQHRQTAVFGQARLTKVIKDEGGIARVCEGVNTHAPAPRLGGQAHARSKLDM